MVQEDIIKKWRSNKKPAGPGRPKVYSDEAIRCGLMIKAVFRLPFRALQGLMMSLIHILDLALVCPNYTIFCRRANGLKISMTRFLKPGEKLHIIFDSTQGL